MMLDDARDAPVMGPRGGDHCPPLVFLMGHQQNSFHQWLLMSSGGRSSFNQTQSEPPTRR